MFFSSKKNARVFVLGERTQCRSVLSLISYHKAILIIMVLVLSSCVFSSITYADEPKFLTLPFSGEKTLGSGWYYNCPEDDCTSDDCSLHKGIDYYLDHMEPIRAAHDGVAMTSQQKPTSSYSYGYFVRIKDENGYETLYAHLDHAAGGIKSYPEIERGNTKFEDWTPVVRGQIIGYCGISGTDNYHLHFEVQTAYVTGRKDPYGVYCTKDHYPGDGSGADYMWTTFPPSNAHSNIVCNELPKVLTPNAGAISGQVCVGTFQQYFFPVIADGRTYKITVTPSTGEDVNLFSSNNPDDINNKDALLNWDTTCPSGAIHCASSTQMGDAVEIIEFDAPTDGVNYQSWFSVYGVSGDGMVDYTVKVESWVKKPDVGIDVVFIMDVTGSTGGLLPGWRIQMPSVIADIQSEFADARFGLVSHLDFPFNPYGGGGEWAYKLESPLSSDPAVTISALGRISNGWGNDGPESQYEAIYQSLTGEGRDLNCDGDYNDNGEILPSHMGYDPNHLIILFHFTYPPIFHNRDVEPNYPFPGACSVAGRTMTYAIMKEKPVIYFGLVTTSMKKILIDPQTDEMIDNPLLFSGAVNPMQELADITGGAVLSVGSDLRGLEQAIKEAVDHVDLTKPGDLSVLVHKDSTPLQSVLVSVSDINGNQIDRGFTNSGGYLVSDSLPVGTYFVSILPPLGYTTITTIKEFSILPNGVTSVIFNLEQMDIIPTQQRLSYWKYKVNAAIYGNTKDDSLVNAYRFPLLADLIYNHFQNNPIHPIPIFGDYYPSSPRSKVFALLELLGGDLPEIDTITVPLDGVFSKSSFIDDGPWTYKIRAIRELTSLFLNITSNKLAARQVASTDGITVSQVITYTTDFIYDDDSTNDQESYNMLHDLNAGTMLRAGLIPSSILEVFYMQSANGSNEMPTKFTLSQNYPNPFNPTTTISFSLPEASNVKLEVYNLLGQVVSTVYEGHLGYGQYTYSWDGSVVASGVYLYKLTAGDFVKTKKMILLK